MKISPTFRSNSPSPLLTNNKKKNILNDTSKNSGSNLKIQEMNTNKNRELNVEIKKEFLFQSHYNEEQIKSIPLNNIFDELIYNFD